MIPNYFKTQSEVASIFKVSNKTVTNWVVKAKQGELKLQLIDIDGKTYILNNEFNRSKLADLSVKGKKHNPVSKTVEVTVSDEIYEILNANQLVSLINSIRFKKELPLKFSYLGKGGEYWLEGISEDMIHNEEYGYPVQIYLLEKTLHLLESYLSKFESVNVVDLGSGNFGNPFGVITHLKKRNLFGKYIALDISPTILGYSDKQFQKYFKDEIIETYLVDFENQSLESILYQSKLSDHKKVLNLLLLQGGTIGNFNNQIKILNNISSGMFPEDLLLIDNAYDTELNKAFFPAFENDYWGEFFMYIVSLLQIPRKQIESEYTFNEKKLQRELKIVFKTDIKIKFPKLETEIEIPKEEKLLVWSHKRDTFGYISEKIKQADLNLQAIIKNPGDLPEVVYIVKN